MLAFNPELDYIFTVGGPVKPYAGAGLGINIIDFNSPTKGSTSTKVGINLLGGIQTLVSGGRLFMVELKIGAGDIPDIKLTFGVTL